MTGVTAGRPLFRVFFSCRIACSQGGLGRAVIVGIGTWDNGPLVPWLRDAGE